LQKATISILTLILLLFSALSLIFIQSTNAGIAPVENSWATKAPMQIARSYLGVASVNGKIYAIGGISVPSVLDVSHSGGLPVFTEAKIVGTNEEYDPLTNTWSTKTDMLIARAHFAIAAFENEVYCIGGTTDSTAVPVNEVYYPSNDSWTTKALLPTPEEGMQANIVNGKIYVIGGGPNYVYNPASDNWTAIASMPNAPNGTQSSCVYDNKIYVVGSPCMQIYNPENNTWTAGIQIPIAATQPIAVATSGLNAPAQIYIFEESVLAAFNPQTNSWMDAAVLPPVQTNPGSDVDRVVADHRGYGVTVLNDVIYVVGGESVTSLKSSFYTEDTAELAINQAYIPFGYGTIPPEIIVSSPLNANYSSSDVALNFSINKPVNWTGYSLDGQQNVTLTGNITISNLKNGLHSLTVYANDTYGNTGASQTITFNVGKTAIATSLTTTTVLIAAPILIVCFVAGLLIYLKKHRGSIKS